MDIEKIYDELCQVEQLELKGPISQKKGIFKPSDLINVFSHSYLPISIFTIYSFNTKRKSPNSALN